MSMLDALDKLATAVLMLVVASGVAAVAALVITHTVKLLGGCS